MTRPRRFVTVSPFPRRRLFMFLRRLSFPTQHVTGRIATLYFVYQPVHLGLFSNVGKVGQQTSAAADIGQQRYRRTTDTGQRTPDNRRRTADTGQQTPDSRHRTADTGRQTPDSGSIVGQQTPDSTADVGQQTPDSRHRTADTGQQTPDSSSSPPDLESSHA